MIVSKKFGNQPLQYTKYANITLVVLLKAQSGSSPIFVSLRTTSHVPSSIFFTCVMMTANPSDACEAANFSS